VGIVQALLKSVDEASNSDLTDKKKWAWSESVGAGIFAVVDMGERPNQDRYKMVFIVDGNVMKDWGSHPSLPGSKKFFNNRIKGGDGMDFAK